MLEALLFRTTDAELRVTVFRHLVRVDGAGERIAARALADTSPARARVMLELAALPGLPPELSVRWLSDAATHADAGVRTDAARLAAAVGGRGGLRVLLDLLGDRDPAVKRAAAQALGALGDTAAVPFLVRLVGEAGDEEVQVAVIGALGRLRSGEALPALLGVVNRRSGLFGAKKLSRPKSAAIAAIARIPTPAAREVIESLAGGKDAEVAAEAQRVLGTID
jgi:HEAT repeat protein